MADMDVNELCAEFVKGSYIDYTGFWEIVTRIDDVLKPKNPDERKKYVVSLVRCLITSGLIPVVYRDGKYIRAFKECLNEASLVEKIQNEWLALGKEPGLGEVCWFADQNWKEKQ
jgi:hypothetical protein